MIEMPQIAAYHNKLPDYYTLLWPHIHLVSLGDAECIVEALYIAQSSIYTVDAERVNVNLCEALLLLVGDILCPECSIADIEALLTSEAVDVCWSALSPCMLHKSCVCKAKTTLVSDILTQRELTISKQARKNLDSVELVNKHLRLSLECCTILGCPPVVHVTHLVELRALVVEAMGHLVSDNHADSTIVHSIVGIRVVEWTIC